jgi:hypothetical protein
LARPIAKEAVPLTVDVQRGVHRFARKSGSRRGLAQPKRADILRLRDMVSIRESAPHHDQWTKIRHRVRKQAAGPGQYRAPLIV